MMHPKILYAGLIFLLIFLGAFFSYLYFSPSISSSISNLPVASSSPSLTTSVSTPEKSSSPETTKTLIKIPASTTPVSTSSIPTTPSPIYKTVMTTLFWVGEASDAENDYIPNHESYWDSFWMEHFGGIDDPECRSGYNPCSFTPKENPFYFALPYGDRTSEQNDSPKSSLKQIPWYQNFDPETESLLKNHWIEIKYKEKTCYAQWQDVGPNEMDDFNYVFGSGKPINTFGERAGLDLSPAAWDCLGLTDNTPTAWRFVDDRDVPTGPWKNIVTTRGLSF